MKAKTSSCFLDIIFSPKEHLKFTRISSLLKSTQCFPTEKNFSLKEKFMSWKKKKAFIFKVLEAFIKQGNKVIQVIKGSHTGENVTFWLH